MLELMITIFIMTVGLIGIFSLIQQTTSFVSMSSSKLTASYLAQEGIEVVRNIADTNLLVPGTLWNKGLVLPDIDCNSGCEADYNNSALSLYGVGRYLMMNGGFYNYTSGTNTKFKRKINVTSATDGDGWDYLKISVKVSWQEKGKPYQTVTAEERLYNWRQ